jgi:iron complex outermembrane recepter protein
MKNKILTLFAVTAGITFVISVFQPAYAQESASEEFTLEEITVTAQKREQNVQDVPIAMTIATQEQLERQMVYTLQDLARTTPGLEFGDGGPGGGGVIRGIGTSTLTGAQMEPSVGVVVDGVPQGSTNIGNMFDMERVEVLRGPQGTLFGNSASAGVINIVTASPDIKGFRSKVGFDVTYDGTLGSKFGRQELRAMINIPLNEISAIRLTGNGNFTQGLKKNKWPGMDDSDSKNLDFRIKYLYKPTEDFSLNLAADYATRKTNGPNLFTMTYLRSTPDETQAPLIDFPYLTAYFKDTCGITASPENQDVCTDFLMKDRDERYDISAQVDWKMANHDFVSISSYRNDTFGPFNQNIFGYGHPKTNSIPEFVGIPINPFVTIYPGQVYFLDIRRTNPAKNTTETLSEELRMAAPAGQKFDYVSGIFYTQTDSESKGPPGTTQMWIPAPPPFVTQGATTTSTSRGSYKSQNMAAFADGNYPMTDALKVLGGVRYSRYINKIYNQVLDSESGTYGPAIFGEKADESYLTWRAGAQYNINTDTMLYGTISRGVKAPVIVREDPTDPNSDYKIIDAEMPTSYEIGTKIAAFNNKLALDFNAFYNDIKDYQGQECSYDQLEDQLACSPTTIDNVISKGIEVDIFGQPMQGVTVNMGYIFNIAEYPAGFADQLTGEQLQNAPRNKFTFSGEYGGSVTGALYGFFAMDTVYKSEKRLNNMWYASSVYPSCWVFGAKIGVREINGKWDLTLFGRNLFGEPEPQAIYQALVDQVHMSITNENSYTQVGLSFNVNF